MPGTHQRSAHQERSHPPSRQKVTVRNQHGKQMTVLWAWSGWVGDLEQESRECSGQPSCPGERWLRGCMSAKTPRGAGGSQVAAWGREVQEEEGMLCTKAWGKVCLVCKVSKEASEVTVERWKPSTQGAPGATPWTFADMADKPSEGLEGWLVSDLSFTRITGCWMLEWNGMGGAERLVRRWFRLKIPRSLKTYQCY